MASTQQQQLKQYLSFRINRGLDHEVADGDPRHPVLTQNIKSTRVNPHLTIAHSNARVHASPESLCDLLTTNIQVKGNCLLSEVLHRDEENDASILLRVYRIRYNGQWHFYETLSRVVVGSARDGQGQAVGFLPIHGLPLELYDAYYPYINGVIEKFKIKGGVKGAKIPRVDGVFRGLFFGSKEHHRE